MSIYDSLLSSNTSTPTKISGSIYDSLVSTPKVAQTQPPLPGSTATSLGGIDVPVAAVRGAVAGFQNTPTAPKSLSLTAPGQATMDAFTNAIQQGGKNLSDQFDTITSSGSPLKVGVALGQSAVGTISSMFGALLSPLQGYATVPIIGSVVDGVNKVFGAIGEGAGTGAAKIIADSPLSQETKDTITPLVHDTVALVAQIYAGKAIDSGYKSISDNSVQILKTLNEDPAMRQAIAEYHTPDNATKVPVTSETPNETKIPVNGNGAPEIVTPEIPSKSVPNNATIEIPSETKVDENGFRPVQKDEVLPSGYTTKMNISTGEQMTNAPIPEQGGLKFNQNINDKQDFQKEASLSSENSGQNSRTNIGGSDKTIGSEGNQSQSGQVNDSETPKPTTGNKISGVANSVEAKAIEAKLTQGYADKAGYDSSTFKEQGQKVADLLDSGIDTARAVVRDPSLRPDIKAGALIAGMEEYAKNNPSEAGAIMQELANSGLTSTISGGASETSFARMREADSASARLQEIKDAKVKQAGGDKVIAKERVATQEKANKVLLPKEDTYWAKFLDNITC